MTKRITVLTATAMLATVALQAAAAGPRSPEASELVTLAVDRFYDDTTKSHHFHFTGAISPRATGEYVAVLYQRCGQSFGTSVAGTTTVGGGAWGASPNVTLVAGSGTYTARWKDDVSKPVRVHPPLGILVSRRGTGRIRVSVTPYEIPQSMHGRVAVLQRLQAGKWRNVRRSKLALERKSGSWQSYGATFSYPVREATLRAAVPAVAASPCFSFSTSKKWRS